MGIGPGSGANGRHSFRYYNGGLMEEREEKLNYAQVIPAGIIAGIIGWYSATQFYGTHKIEFIKDHKDKLFCEKSTEASDPLPKCYIIREYKHPKIQEMIFKLKREGNNK